MSGLLYGLVGLGAGLVGGYVIASEKSPSQSSSKPGWYILEIKESIDRQKKRPGLTKGLYVKSFQGPYQSRSDAEANRKYPTDKIQNLPDDPFSIGMLKNARTDETM